MAAVVLGELKARSERMRALSDVDRVAAIAGAHNVVGFDRFIDRRHQIVLRDTYRRTFQGNRP